VVDPVLDPETGFQYLRARYYDPTTGQFLTRDPLEAITGQPYSYAQDNPVNGTDPTGLCGTGSIGDLFDCVNPTSSGNLAYQAASAAWQFGTTHTIGVCVGGSLVAGIGFTGQVCVQGNLHSAGVTVTGGPVVGSPSAGVSAGIEASNAHNVCELGSYFDNTTVTIKPTGEGPQGVGETGSGTLPGGRTVTYYYGGAGLGASIPPFASGSTGTTNTSTASVGSSCGC
jgi:RHS repeat-associated protein